MNNPNYERRHYRRPILLTIVAVLEILMGVSIMVGGAISLVVGIPEGVIEDVGLSIELAPMVSSALIILIGFITFSIGLALFSGKMWGWWFAVIMTVLSLISTLATGLILPIVFNLIVLIYLMTENTRGWFRNESARR